MKDKIIKILNKPKTVIFVTAVLALVVGIVVYKNVGISPVIQISNDKNTEYNLGEGINLAFPKGGRVNKVLIQAGQQVKKGQVLANLDFSDAAGSLLVAKSNYEKVLNGATGADIDVAKATVETAKTAFDQAQIQQETLVKNAKKNLLNSGFLITTKDELSTQTPPIVSGTYLGDKEGVLIINEYGSSGGVSFKTKGLVEATGMTSSQIPQPIGNTGLYIKFQNNTYDTTTEWILNIPNTQSTLYLQNLNAYQSALSTQNQVIANAEAQLNQTKSILLLKQSNARPEDVASAEGALSVAQGVYDNNFIYAPIDGTITAVNVKEGETIAVNQKAISMIAGKIIN